jgi:hypothetical protein
VVKRILLGVIFLFFATQTYWRCTFNSIVYVQSDLVGPNCKIEIKSNDKLLSECHVVGQQMIPTILNLNKKFGNIKIGIYDKESKLVKSWCFNAFFAKWIVVALYSDGSIEIEPYYIIPPLIQ